MVWSEFDEIQSPFLRLPYLVVVSFIGPRKFTQGDNADIERLTGHKREQFLKDLYKLVKWSQKITSIDLSQLFGQEKPDKT